MSYCDGDDGLQPDQDGQFFLGVLWALGLLVIGLVLAFAFAALVALAVRASR